MAEIKSTLELIMERTKNLTLTDEEKRNFQKKEVQGKVKGFLMKFMDGVMDLEKLKKGIVSLEEKDPELVKEIVIRECLDRISLQGDSAMPFDILEQVVSVDIAPFQKLLSEFLSELDNTRKVREQGMQKQIQEKGISGSAVLPNLSADPEWAYFWNNLEIKFHEEMKDLVPAADE